MKVAEVTAFNRPLEIVERDIPTPAAGQVLVRLEACGLCHTDIHAAGGDWPVKPVLPIVPGHEGVGIIEALGDGVNTRTVGERVAIAWLARACGECRGGVLTVAARGDGAVKVCGCVRECDAGVRDGGARGVRHDAYDRAGLLREGCSGQQQNW